MAAALPLQTILGYKYLCGLVEAVKTGIPQVLPEGWFTTTRDVMKDSGQYTRTAGTRKTSRRVGYDAPSQQRELSPVGVFDVKLVHTREHIQLKISDFMSLRGYTNYGPQDIGLQEISRQALQFRQVFDNLEIAQIYSLLSLGAIYFDSDGNLLPSSSGAACTIDFGVNAAHRSQIKGPDGSTDIVDAPWTSAFTNIPLHIATILRQSIFDTGYVLEHGYYGLNLPTDFAINNYVQPFLARTPGKREVFLDTGAVPDGLFDVKKWIPAANAFYEDEDGDKNVFWDDDQLTLCPGPQKSIYEMLKGQYPIPSSYQPQTNLNSAVGTFELKTGMFMYARPCDEPPTAKLIAGNTSLPVYKVPDSMYLVDTTP